MRRQRQLVLDLGMGTMIGATGGTAVATNGNRSVQIGAGALATTTTITTAPAPNAFLRPPPAPPGARR